MSEPSPIPSAPFDDLDLDRPEDEEEWERRVKVIADSVSGIPSLTTSVDVPAIANSVPHLQVRWDQTHVKLTPMEVLRKLREGEPSIEANPGTNHEQLVIGVWMLQAGEAEIVARRLKAILRAA